MSEMLREPIRDRSAWKATDFENDDSWIYRFSDAELAEIDAAMRSIKARGLDVPNFGREEFPLPTLQAKVANIVAEVEDGRGFALFRGIPVDDYDLIRYASSIGASGPISVTRSRRIQKVRSWPT